MSNLCLLLHFSSEENDREKKNVKRNRELYTSQYLSFQNSYDHEIFYTFSPTHLPSK